MFNFADTCKDPAVNTFSPLFLPLKKKEDRVDSAYVTFAQNSPGFAVLS
jgi:hypothetical protein